MGNYFLIFWSVLCLHLPTFGQQDTTQIKTKKPLLSSVIVPTSFILSGTLLSGTTLEKKWQTNIRNKVGNDYHYGIDDVVQYVPYAQIYLGDIIGLTAKNHWFDQTKNIFIGGLATLVITHSLKRGVGKERPDGSSNHSFSSGHTATAFLGSTLLYHEFKSANTLYATSGFLFASTTGGFRVLNNRHWVSDVLAGAGIGMLVGTLIHHIEPLKNFNPFKKTRNLSFTPMVSSEGLTLLASFQF